MEEVTCGSPSVEKDENAPVPVHARQGRYALPGNDLYEKDPKRIRWNISCLMLP